MSTAELPCYTLINVPSDSEALSEQKLAEDLGKFSWSNAREAKLAFCSLVTYRYLKCTMSLHCVTFMLSFLLPYCLKCLLY